MSALVRGLEADGDLQRDAQRLVGRDGSLLEALGQVFALDEFHGQEADPSTSSMPI